MKNLLLTTAIVAVSSTAAFADLSLSTTATITDNVQSSVLNAVAEELGVGITVDIFAGTTNLTGTSRIDDNKNAAATAQATANTAIDLANRALIAAESASTTSAAAQTTSNGDLTVNGDLNISNGLGGTTNVHDSLIAASSQANSARIIANQASSDVATVKSDITEINDTIGNVNEDISDLYGNDVDLFDRVSTLENATTADQTSLETSYSIGDQTLTATVETKSYGSGVDITAENTIRDNTKKGEVYVDHNNTGLYTNNVTSNNDGYDEVSASVNSNQGNKVTINVSDYSYDYNTNEETNESTSLEVTSNGVTINGSEVATKDDVTEVEDTLYSLSNFVTDRLNPLVDADLDNRVTAIENAEGPWIESSSVNGTGGNQDRVETNIYSDGDFTDGISVVTREDGSTFIQHGGNGEWTSVDLVNKDELTEAISNITVTSGVDGVDGRDGINGTDGLNGRDGVDGVDGQDGLNGIDGVDGKDGLNGLNGIDGADGKDGVDGRDGIDGVTTIVHTIDADTVETLATKDEVATVQSQINEVNTKVDTQIDNVQTILTANDEAIQANAAAVEVITGNLASTETKAQEAFDNAAQALGTAIANEGDITKTSAELAEAKANLATAIDNVHSWSLDRDVTLVNGTLPDYVDLDAEITLAQEAGDESVVTVLTDFKKVSEAGGVVGVIDTVAANASDIATVRSETEIQKDINDEFRKSQGKWNDALSALVDEREAARVADDKVQNEAIRTNAGNIETNRQNISNNAAAIKANAQRISRESAKTAATLNAVVNAPTNKGVGVGIGNNNGETALSVAARGTVSQDGSITWSATLSADTSGDVTVGAGIGFTF